MSLLSVVHDSAVSLNNELQKNVLTNFSPMSHFYTPWKRQKNYDFLISYDSTQMSQNMPKRLFFLLKQLQLTMQLFALTVFQSSI